MRSKMCSDIKSSTWAWTWADMFAGLKLLAPNNMFVMVTWCVQCVHVVRCDAVQCSAGRLA